MAGELVNTTRELDVAGSRAREEYGIKSSLELALFNKRNEDVIHERLLLSCQRARLALAASYSFPRGGQTVRGPSIHLAREMARLFGNIQYGHDIILDDDESRGIRSWAWDLETNTKIFSPDQFKKLIYKKNGGWVVADERDLRELTNRRAAIATRNAILSIMPDGWAEDALERCAETLRKQNTQDPEEARQRMEAAFQGINVTLAELEGYLDCPLKDATPDQIADLRGVYESIKDGVAKKDEFFGKAPSPSEPAGGKIDIDGLKAKKDPEKKEPEQTSAATSESSETENPQKEASQPKPQRAFF